jgi:predicted nucleic acid-binding Zn ribbon protein
MTDTPQLVGADLARQALAAARAAAKNTPTPKARSTRARREPGSGRDPVALGNILDGIATNEGWKDSLGAGDITDRWPDLCPTVYADKTSPAGFDPDTGTLAIRPATHAAATGLRMAEPQLVKHINRQLARPVVRRLRILAVGAQPASAADRLEAAPRQETDAPVKTRETASPGYRATLEAALTNKPEPRSVDPDVLEALDRQETALRAHRETADQFTDGVAEAERVAGPVLDRSEAVRRAALERKRLEATGAVEPRRVFDVA